MDKRTKEEMRIQALEKLGAIDWEIKGLLWSDVIINTSTTPITESVFNAKVDELTKEWEAQEYARSRKTDYPDIGDQLDYMFHNGFDKWKEDIVQPVKDKYPKPE